MDARPQPETESDSPRLLTPGILLLAPLLMVQGLYVRTVTPRLPEAAGERSGVAGSGTPLRLLIAGDSAAAGVGVGSQEDALAGQLIERVSAHHEIAWDLVAATGLTSSDLLDRLAAMPARRYDVALVSIGVNDVTGLTSIPRWRANLTALVGLLERRFGATHTLLSALPPMHLFPALPQPLRWAAGARATALNRVMSEVARGTPSASYLATRVVPAADAMATDGFHPGAPVYAAWANAAADAILGRDEVNSL